MKNLIQESIKNLHLVNNAGALATAIWQHAAGYYFIKAVDGGYWNGISFELPKDVLIFTAKEVNDEVVKMQSSAGVEVLSLRSLLNPIVGEQAFEFEYSERGITTPVGVDYFSGRNGFTLTEIIEIRQVKKGGIWRSKSDHNRVVTRRAS